MDATRPNLLLILTDQQRADTIGPAAPEYLRTPHLDWLAAGGVRMDRAYADCPVSVPSRIAIMTGQDALGHGMLVNGSSSSVLNRRPTLPMRLAALGYQTAAIGKMHFTPQRARHGFGEMVLPADYYREMASRGELQQPMRHGLGQNELFPGMATVPESMTLTSWTAERAVEYIRDRRDPTVPFFLWVSFTKPHPPLDPPEPYYSMYRGEDIPEQVMGDWATDDVSPPAFARQRHRALMDQMSASIIREARAAYLGLVTQIDYNIGRIISALQDVDLLDRTVIMFASDHGEFLGDHGQAGKSMFHEPSARVPMVLRSPVELIGGVGRSSQLLASLADVAPTLIGAAGGASDELEGQDLLALLRGEDVRQRKTLVGIAAGNREPDDMPYYAAITDDRWKYIWYPEGGIEQVFDLQNDPHELHDLALHGPDDHQHPLTELKAELIACLTKAGSPVAREGSLVALPPRNDTIADRRLQSWPGFHTDTYEVDVRH
jgi:arylsulfatase